MGKTREVYRVKKTSTDCRLTRSCITHWTWRILVIVALLAAFILPFTVKRTTTIVAPNPYNDVIIVSGGGDFPAVVRRALARNPVVPETLPHYREVYINASEYYRRGELLALRHLRDVSITEEPIDGHALVYSGPEGKWVPKNITHTNITTPVDQNLIESIVESYVENITTGYQNQLMGTRNPLPSDDAVLGYSKNSVWLVQGTNAVWKCVDATEGAAVWKRLDLYPDSISAIEIQDHSIGAMELDSAYQKRVASGVAALDAFGKLYSDQIPDISVTNVRVVQTILDRDALTGVGEGDVAVVLQADQFNHTMSYIFDGTLWQQMYSASEVMSVAGKIGHVLLTTLDVTEDPARLFFTQLRVSANGDVIAAKTHADIVSGNPHGITLSMLGATNYQNTKHNHNALTNPTVTDDSSLGYSVGSQWCFPAENSVFICSDATVGAAVWIRLDLADGSVTNVKIANDAVEAQHIHHDAVTTDAIADGSVTLPKMAPNSVGNSQLIDMSVTTNIIENLAVTDAKLAQNSVTSQKIVDGSITAPKMGSASVTTDSLAASSVTTSKLATGSVTSTTILDGTIQAVDMVSAYQKEVANGICALDAQGLVKTSQLPPISVTSVVVVANITERNALSAQEGDFAIVSDSDGEGHAATYVYTVSGWLELEFNAPIKTVNGKVGHVMLSTDDIVEGSNLYFTHSRVSLNADVSSALAHSLLTSGNPHGVTKADVGLPSLTDILSVWSTNIDPSTIDDMNAGYKHGSHWINSATGAIFMCVDPSAGMAQWKRLDLADNSVTTAKIANDAVRSAQILDGSITDSDVDSNLIQERVTGTCASDAHIYSIAIDGSVSCSSAVAPNTVGASQIVDGSIYTAELADLTVTNPKLALNSVGTANVIDGSLVAADVDSSSIQLRVVGVCPAGSKIKSISAGGGVVCDSTIADDTVTSAKIVDGSISTADYGAASVTLSKMATSSVDSAKIVDNSILEADMSAAYKKRVANGVAALDGNGKIYGDQLPAMGTAVYVVANITERDALSAITGDFAKVVETGENFIYDGTQWILFAAAAAVESVQTQTGHVSLDSDDIPEGSANFYFTQGRVSLNSDVVAAKSHADITSGNPHGITKATIGLSFVQNVKHWIDTVNPTVNNDASEDFITGSYWINSAIGGAYICTDNTNGAAVWNRIDLYPASVGTTELQASSVTSIKIQDGSIVYQDTDTTSIQRRVSGSCSSGAKITAINVDGTVSCDSSVPSNSVSSSQIVDLSIVSADLADGSVTSGKLATDSVTSAKVLDGTLTYVDTDTTSIQRRVVGTCSAGSFITAVSEPGGVTCSSTLASNSVGASQLQSSAVTNAKIGSAAVTLAKMATSSVDSSKIVDDTIVEADMSSAYKRGVANGVATLNAFGVVPDSQLPARSITSVYVVADITARDALTVQEGDVAKVLSNEKTYMWDGTSTWVELTSGVNVETINGISGPNAVIDTSNVAEGSNLYFTQTRVSANTDVIASKAHSELVLGNPHAVTKSDVGLGNLANIKSKYDATIAPSATDDANDGYSVGSIWIDISGDRSYQCVDSTNSAAVWREISVGDTTNHGSLTGLSDDDHIQYARLMGRSGGQVLHGGIGAGEDLTLESTTHATKGDVRTIGHTVINNQDYTNPNAYECSIHGAGTSVWLELLNSAGGDKGVFFGMETNDAQIWSYQGGAFSVFTDVLPSSGIERFRVEPDGTTQITDLSSGVVKSSSTGVLSSEAVLSGFNLALGTTAGTVAEGNHGHTAAHISDFSSAVDARITAQKGTALGLATLDAGGKVPASQLNFDGLDYQSAWDANTNTPTLVSGVGTKGHFYIVDTAGTTTIDGISEWAIGDWIVYSGSIWQKLDNSDAVNSVAGKTGAVTLVVADISNAGTAATKNTGSSSGTVPLIGTGGITASKIIVSDGSSQLIGQTQNTGFNKAFGTTAGTVSEGNHGHANLQTTGYIDFTDMSAPANAGAGKGRLYKKVGDDGLFWKPDAGGAEVDLTDLGPAGEVNTASNVGTGGVSIYKQKSGANLQFKSVNSASSAITVTDDTGNNEVDISLVPANIPHNSLSGYVANEHVNHASVSVLAGTGLSGGGTIAATRTLNLDINGLTSTATVDVANDYLPMYDASAGAIRKVLVSNIVGSSVTSYGEIYYSPSYGSSTVVPASSMLKITVSSTLSSGASNFDSPTNARLRYTGSATKTFLVSYTLTGNAGGDRDLRTELRKNGIKFAGADPVFYWSKSGKEGSINVNTIVQLVTNDYLEVFAQNIENGANLQIQFFKITAIEISSSGGGGGGDFFNGGEAGGATRSLGNTDSYDLQFKTNNQARITIQADGDIGFGITNPLATFHAEAQTTDQEVFIVRGKSGQTANLFEARKSDNSKPFAVDSNGNLDALSYKRGGDAVIPMTHYHYAAQESELQTSSTTLQTVVTLTTSFLPSGTYRLGYSMEISNLSNGVLSEHEVILDGDIVSLTTYEADNDIQLSSGFVHKTLSGVITATIKQRVQTTGTSICRRARLELWRVA